MKRAFTLYVLLLLLLPFSISAQVVVMSQGEVAISEGSFADPAGLNNDYVDTTQIYIVQTLCSETYGDNDGDGNWEQSWIHINFIEFALGLGDTLFIYDGDDITAPLIGAFNGVSTPGDIYSSTGCLTFLFVTDGIVDLPGMNSGWRGNFAPYFEDPQIINLNSASTTIETCHAKFYDAGGPSASFTAPGASGQQIVFQGDDGQHVRADINTFTIPSTATVEIFDGNIISMPTEARRIGYFKSSFPPPSVIISSGQFLSFKITGTGTAAGWDIDISCVAEIYEQEEGASGCPDISIGRYQFGGDFQEADTIAFNCTDPLIILRAVANAPGHLTNDYTVQSIPYDPPFAFYGGGLTYVPANADDQWHTTTQLPANFGFSFYGSNYTQVVTGLNGAISFNNINTPTGSGYSYSQTIPNVNDANFTFISGNNHKNCVFGVFQDTYPGAGSPPANSGIWYGQMGESPCRTFVMSFYRLPQFSCTSDNLSTYQMVLYEGSNIIDVYVYQRSVCSSWNSGSGLIGILNSMGNMAVVPPGRNTGSWTVTPPNSEAWRFIPITPTDYDIKWYENTVSPATEIVNNNSDKKLLTVFPQTTTTYIGQITFTASSGVEYTVRDTVVVTVDRPQFHLTSSANAICPEEEVTLSVVADNADEQGRLVTFHWLNSGDNTTVPNNTFMPSQTTEYTVVVTYDNACTNSSSTTVEVTDMFKPEIIGDTLICSGDVSTLTATNIAPNGVIAWSTGESNATINVSPSESKDYMVSVTSPIGCVTKDTITVNINESPIAAFSPNPPHVYVEDGEGPITFINLSTEADSNLWNFGDNYCINSENTSNLEEPTHIYTRSGTYTVSLTVFTEALCQHSTSTTVIVEVPYFYYIPNAFSPNDDGINDYFFTSGEGLDPDNFEMLIFNRYGQLVFKSTTPFDYWDGRDRNGKMSDMGEYIYKITTHDMEGIAKTYSGTIMLVR